MGCKGSRVQISASRPLSSPNANLPALVLEAHGIEFRAELVLPAAFLALRGPLDVLTVRALVRLDVAERAVRPAYCVELRSRAASVSRACRHDSSVDVTRRVSWRVCGKRVNTEKHAVRLPLLNLQLDLLNRRRRRRREQNAAVHAP